MATKLTDAASIEAILAEMSIEEKAACITGAGAFSTRAMEKYGIPSLLMLDGGTGFNTSQMCWEAVFNAYEKQCREAGTPVDPETYQGRMGALEEVLCKPELLKERMEYMKKSVAAPKPHGCYPPGMTLAATWSPETVAQVGHALGEEVNALGVDVLLGSPNVNIHRDPRNGRLFEGYSEDPCLTAKLAPELVRGVQAEGIIANAKHFAANNQETERMGVNEHIPERALREIYLPGFRACVKAGCKSVMAAYNLINGIPCAQNRWLLQDVLRNEWGFDGFVVTDWSAAYDQVEACAAGNDVVMPGPRQMKTVVDAVKNGILPEAQLDACVRNYLRIVLQAPAMRGRKPAFDMNKGTAAAYRAAAESITLLKNNGVLPLRMDAQPAFFGKRSLRMTDSGAGSAAVLTSLTTNLLPCVQALLGEDHVSYETVRPQTTVVIATVGSNGQEGADRPDMKLEPEDAAVLDRAVASAKEHKLPLVVLLNIAAPVELEPWIEDIDALVCLYIPGMQGGQAAADVLFGTCNPSGKLPITFPKAYRDCPTYGNFPGYNSDVWYGEGIYVGYRYYEKKGIAPLYPFGFGLSYTTFELTGAFAPEQIDVDKEAVEISVSIHNTGKIAGAEVIQVYVHDDVSTLDKPFKELKAFRKVYLEAGEEKTVTLRLEKDDFASYDTRLEAFAVEPGRFTLMIGTGSDQIAWELPVMVMCENPYALGPKSDIVRVVSHPQATEILRNLTGVKLREAASSYIIFQPEAAFAQVWQESILKTLKLTQAESDALLAQVYAQWKTL